MLHVSRREQNSDATAEALLSHIVQAMQRGVAVRNWTCLCGNFVRGKRFCPRCKLMRFRIEKHPVLAYFDMKLGKFEDGMSFNFPLAKLASHLLISGQTGTGKTRLGMNLAVKAGNFAKPNRIRLLIMDVEGEWKNIIPQLEGKTEYYSVGKNLRINPFDLNDPALIRELMRQTVFKGIEKEYMDLTAQMNMVLQDAIYKSSNMQELIENVKNYENKRLNSPQKTKTALLVRLDPFMRSPLKEIFMCKKSNPDFERLDECNMIIDLHELDKLVAYNPEVRLIYNVVTTYFLRKMLNREPCDDLSNLFISDEAQLLVPKILRKLIVTETWPAAEIAIRLRKRGVGMVLITQRPSNLERDIIDNCATKISFRVQDQDDIKILSDCVGFTDIVEREYMTEKFVHIPTKNAIVCMAGHEPFLFTAEDFEPERFNPELISEPKQIKADEISAEVEADSDPDERKFLENIKSKPFLSVAERRKSLGWHNRKYSRIISGLLTEKRIEKVEVRLGRGAPVILYQKPGTIPSVRHEFYVHKLAGQLEERGFHVILNRKEGPDIEIPEISAAIEVELGKSNVYENMKRDSQEFEKVVVCSDEKKLLEDLSRENKAGNIFVSSIEKVVPLFGKMSS